MSWAPDYVTLVEAKKFLRLDDHLDDDTIVLFCATASRAVDNHCRRQFGVVDAAEHRLYEVVWDRHRGRHIIAIDDLMTTTGFSVTIEGETLTPDDWRLEPVNNVVKGKPWTELVLLRGPLGRSSRETYADAVGQWGWTIGFPAPVKLATRMQMNRFNARRSSPFGVAGSPQDGSEIRLQAKLDPDVITALGTDLVRW